MTKIKYMAIKFEGTLKQDFDKVYQCHVDPSLFHSGMSLETNVTERK